MNFIKIKTFTEIIVNKNEMLIYIQGEYNHST